MPAPHPWRLPPRSIPVPSPSKPHGRIRIPTPARSTPGPSLTRVALVCLGNLCFLGKVLLEQPRPTRAAPLGHSGQRSHLATDKEWGHSHSQPGSAGNVRKAPNTSCSPSGAAFSKAPGQISSPCAPIATSQRPRLLSAALLLAGFVFGF